MTEQIRLQIQRQRGALTEITLSINVDGVEKDGVRAAFTEHTAGGCRLGRVQLHLDKGPLSEPNNLAVEVPVRAYLRMRERPEKSRLCICLIRGGHVRRLLAASGRSPAAHR